MTAEDDRARLWRDQQAARARHRAEVAPRQLAGDSAARRALEAKTAPRRRDANTPGAAAGGPGGELELEPAGGPKRAPTQAVRPPT